MLNIIFQILSQDTEQFENSQFILIVRSVSNYTQQSLVDNSDISILTQNIPEEITQEEFLSSIQQQDKDLSV